MTADEWAAEAYRQGRRHGRKAAVVLRLAAAQQLGYVRPSDEWVDGSGEPLPDDLQETAHALCAAGLLPGFAVVVS